jgi:hypothetical protein
MSNQRNKLFEQSDEQLSPNRAKPSDFEVNGPETNLEYPYHGQLGDSKAECDALLKVGPKSRGDAERIKTPNQEVANQHVEGKEQSPAKRTPWFRRDRKGR